MTIDATFADDLKKGADHYRRKDVFEFRAFHANRLEVTRGGQTVAFEKVKGQGDQADTWQRLSPTAGAVDREKVEILLSRFANLRAASFVESTAKTGLDAPAMIVVVKFEDGKKEERVAFGKTDADMYASLAGEPGAAKLEAADFNDAIKLLDELSK